MRMERTKRGRDDGSEGGTTEARGGTTVAEWSGRGSSSLDSDKAGDCRALTPELGDCSRPPEGRGAASHSRRSRPGERDLVRLTRGATHWGLGRGIKRRECPRSGRRSPERSEGGEASRRGLPHSAKKMNSRVLCLDRESLKGSKKENPYSHERGNLRNILNFIF